nr:MAG TPA: hypothetical protein [Caudoviricetes sp.]
MVCTSSIFHHLAHSTKNAKHKYIGKNCCFHI